MCPTMSAGAKVRAPTRGAPTGGVGLEGLGLTNLCRVGTCHEYRYTVDEACCRRGGVAGAEPPHKGGPNRPDRTTAVVGGQWSVVSDCGDWLRIGGAVRREERGERRERNWLAFFGVAHWMRMSRCAKCERSFLFRTCARNSFLSKSVKRFNNETDIIGQLLRFRHLDPPIRWQR